MDRIVSARVKAQRWYTRYPRLLSTGVYLLTMAVTLLAVLSIEQAERERLAVETRAKAGAIAAALERRSFAHIAYLRAAATVFAAPGPIDAARFHAFSDGLEADEEYRGGEGLSWSERVAASAIPAFEAERRADGDKGFTVYPAPAAGQDFAIPVTFIGHLAPSNRVPLGFDTWSQITRRKAMAEAVRLDRPTASGRVVLNRSLPGHPLPGFIIYMPVFSDGDGAVAGARHRLRGFVSIPFNAQDFLASALGLTGTSGLGVSLYDGMIGPDHLLARIMAHEDAQPQPPVPVVIAGRRLMLVVSAPSRPVLSRLSWLTLAFGSLAAILLTMLARLVTRQATADRIALGWLQEQASIRVALTQELNHRVKNTLANVLSIIALTRRRARDLDSFAQSLEGRIRALSATHDLLTRRDWGTTPLAAVIAAELTPYTDGPGHAVDLDGPDIELAPNDALCLGLAIHELATNAGKYGALSVPGGRVRVRWAMLGADRAGITWEEHGGPPVPKDLVRGFGAELIERIVAHELGEPVELVFAEEGVRCVLTVPVRMPAAFRMRAE